MRLLSKYFDLQGIRVLLFYFFMIFSSDILANDKNLNHGWIFSPQMDRMTDQNRSYFSKTSGQGALFFKCFGSARYEPGWLFNKYMTSSATFMYRFDKEPPVSVDSGQMFNTNRGLSLDSQRDFTEKALRSSIVVFQARDRDGDVVTQEFQLAGLSKAIEYADKVAPCK